MTPRRIRSYRRKACGLDISWAAECVDEEIMEQLFLLAESCEVQDKMKSMQLGLTMNSTEERAVLHTSMRADVKNGKDIPLRKEVAREREKLRTLCAEISPFDLIWVGIGGSYLGPRALFEALGGNTASRCRVHFVTNVDPDEIRDVIAQVDPERTCVVIVSKSGSTLETSVNAKVLRQSLGNATLISITQQGSTLDGTFHHSFHMWDSVGGRYSATSMVGGVLLALAFSYDRYMQVLKGAEDMDQHVLQSPMEDNLPLISALLGVWNRNILNHPTLAVISYASRLGYFPEHIQQCDMESNGKSVNEQGGDLQMRSGPVIWGGVGTNVQHSFFQLIHQGTDVVPLLFLGVRQHAGHDWEIDGTTLSQKLNSNLFAQAMALAVGRDHAQPQKRCPGNRPSHIVGMESISPHSIGALLAFFEHRTAYQGWIWGVNSFDQEGVECGKLLAGDFLDFLREEDRLDSDLDRETISAWFDLD